MGEARPTQLGFPPPRRAVHREEQRLGRRPSQQEVDALELQTFEPILVSDT